MKYNETISGVVAQYNGNIARQDWQQGTSALQNYTYTYDKLGRLTLVSFIKVRMLCGGLKILLSMEQVSLKFLKKLIKDYNGFIMLTSMETL